MTGLKQSSRARQTKRLRKKRSAAVSSRRERALALELVEAGGAKSIHRVVLKILAEIGVIIEHDGTRKLLIDAGCAEGDDGYVRIPPDQVERALETVPSKILLYDQNGKVRVDTESRVTTYCPGHNCVRVLDHQSGELRPGVLDDIIRTAKVSEQLPNLDMVCTLGYPTDIPAEDEAVESSRAMLELSLIHI